jgi:hypothetical protein
MQLLLGVVFVAAAVTKLRRPSRFVLAVREYALIPSSLSGLVAGGLVALEAFVGISLLAGWGLAISVPIAAGLLGTFAFAVGINLRRGNIVACGCFGSASERISSRTLARIGLLMLAVVVLAVIRLSANPPPLAVASLVVDGADGLQRVVLTGVLAAWLAVMAAWALHIPELTVLARRTEE